MRIVTNTGGISPLFQDGGLGLFVNLALILQVSDWRQATQNQCCRYK